MTTGEAFAVAAEHLKSSRRSAVQVVPLTVAKRIAGGRTRTHLAVQIEEALLASLGRCHDEPDVEIIWLAHVGQPGEPVTRLTWCPGTLLPDRVLFVSCTVSAPLQD